MTAMTPSTGAFGAGLYRKTSGSNAVPGEERRTSERGRSSSTDSARQRSEERNSRWGRRTVQAAVTADRERSQLLRTVSHLNKTQKPGVSKLPGDESLPPLSPADFVPPPQYQGRSRPARSLDLGRRRGLSASEGSGPARTSARLEDESSTPPTAGLGSLGRAKAAQARAKLRRFSVSQLSLSAVSSSSSHNASSAPSPALANNAEATPTVKTTTTTTTPPLAQAATISAPRTILSGAAAPVGNTIMLKPSLALANASPCSSSEPESSGLQLNEEPTSIRQGQQQQSAEAPHTTLQTPEPTPIDNCEYSFPRRRFYVSPAFLWLCRMTGRFYFSCR